MPAQCDSGQPMYHVYCACVAIGWDRAEVGPAGPQQQNLFGSSLE